MILHILKKKNDPLLWDCYKIGYEAEGGAKILTAKDVFLDRKKIKKRALLTEQEWQDLALAYLESSVRFHAAGPMPQYGFSDRSVVSFSDAIDLIRRGEDKGKEIIRRNRELVEELVEDVSTELQESCESDAP